MLFENLRKGVKDPRSLSSESTPRSGKNALRTWRERRELALSLREEEGGEEARLRSDSGTGVRPERTTRFPPLGFRDSEKLDYEMSSKLVVYVLKSRRNPIGGGVR